MKLTINSACRGCVLLLATLGSLPAQTPGKAPASTPDSEVAGVPNPIAEKVTARDLMRQFLEAKGWQEGENPRPDGSTFFVAPGRGAVNAPRSHDRFMESRIMAFDKAMLDAKANMAEYIRKTIETRAVSAYAEGQAPPPPTAGGEAPGMLEKLVTLASNKLDDYLRKEGIDVSGPQAKAAAQKIKATDEFQRFIRKESQAYVAGLQAFQTFEVFPDGKNGEIAVVGVVSDRLLALSAAVAGGSAPPLQKPKKRIIEQIPTSGPELLCSFGVRQLIDENGQSVLVAYGQAQPISESTRAEQAAEQKAQMQAEGALRGFAGEAISSARDSYLAENYKEFEDNTSAYENQSAYKERVEAFGKAIEISGIQVVKRWTQKHPFNGQTVVGTVIAWSPRSAANAAGLADKIAGSQAGRTNPARIPINADQKGAFKGQGAAADDDF